MDLFVLLNSTPRILRVVTSRDLQDDLEGEFRRQISSFTVNKTDVPFDARYRPDDDELLMIEGFDDIDGVIAAVRSPQDTHTWEPSEEGLGTIKGIFGGFTENGITTVMIQAFDRRQAITTGKFALFFDTDTFRRLGGIGITLDNKPTAVLSQRTADNSLTELRFVSLHNTRRLFEMDAYYHESTKEEVESFFNDDKFHGFDAGWLSANIDNWIRKKVTFINQEGILDACTPHELQTAAAGFDIEIGVHDEGGQMKLIFPDDKKGLKALLRFLDEDIYQSPISGNRFQTNSKRKISAQA
ncbi:hypothetical protein [Pseudomonas shirazica]|uniref:hypothetical protein n=1 Tax=Pseudomonas shirazica TaxID=1940636 RepID=UPI0011188E43|nr:hypothetical protein [Pseudomonas shirazica]